MRQLRLALRLVESPRCQPGPHRPAGPVQPSGSAARERYLLRWGRSRIALRRSAYQAFRRLLSFLAYAIPDEPDDPNPNLAAIGYVVEDPGLTAKPTTVRPVDLPAGDPRHRSSLEADVVVVGSGASGGVVARALAEAGRSIVVLEAGPFVPEPEMPRAELDAFDRLYLDHGLTATADGAVSILAGGAVGGGTTINWMTSIAAPDRVRSGWARAHGIDGFDGPEGDADFATLAAELSVTESVDPPPKDVALLRGARAARARGGIDPAERRRLSGLRVLPVRLSGRREAVRAAGPPRCRVCGRGPPRR